MALILSFIHLLFLPFSLASSDFVNYNQKIILSNSIPPNLKLFKRLSTLSDCSLICVKNASELFIYNPSSQSCTIGFGASSIVETSPSALVPYTHVWVDAKHEPTPHLFVIGVLTVGDISLSQSQSPSITGLANWKIGTNFAFGRRVNDQFWVCGGGNAPGITTCYSRLIGQLTSANDVLQANMPRLHRLGTPVTIGDNVWVTGGSSEVNGETSIWNQQGKWSAGPLLPLPMFSHCLVHDINQSYLVGGVKLSTTENLNSLYEYDWTKQQWNTKASMSLSRNGLGCWLIEYPVGSGNKSILAAGGLNAFSDSTPSVASTYGRGDSEIYNLKTGTWSAGPALPALRSDGLSLTVKNRHFWFGGRMGATSMDRVKLVWEFDPVIGWINSTMMLPSVTTIPPVIPYNL